MEMKRVKCPGCGANLSYNYKKHSYTCEYCSSTFVDPGDDKTHNPRVELTPDDLKKVAQQTENHRKAISRYALISLVVGVLIFIIIPIIIFIAQLNLMFEEFTNFDINPY